MSQIPDIDRQETREWVEALDDVIAAQTIGLNLLRRIEGRAATGRLLKARVEMHPELAEAVQNGRRRDFARLEAEYDIEIEIVASHRLHGPEEQIEWRDRPTPIPVPPLRPAQIRERRASSAPDSRLAPVIFEPSPDSTEAPGADAAPREGGEDSATPGEARRNGKKRRRGGRNRRGKRNDGAASPVLPSEMTILFAAGDEPTGDEESDGPPSGDAQPSADTQRAAGPAGEGDARRRRRRGGRNRRGRRGTGAGPGPNGGQGGGNDSGPERGNVDTSPPGEGPRESVEERIARIAAAFAPSI